MKGRLLGSQERKINYYVRHLPQTVSNAVAKVRYSVGIPLSLGDRMILRRLVESKIEKLSKINGQFNSYNPATEAALDFAENFLSLGDSDELFNACLLNISSSSLRRKFREKSGYGFEY